MRLLGEYGHGAFRLRVTDCGCGPECVTRFVFATTHEALWLATGIAEVDDVDEQVALLLADAQIDGEIIAMVALGVALVGLEWPVLTSDWRVALAQTAKFERLPDWMLRVNVRDVWAVRRCVIGAALDRVPNALAALHDAYDPGGVRP